MKLPQLIYPCCVMLVTFFTPPFMHERYGYLADILCIIFAFFYKNKFYIPIFHIGISFLSYTKYYTKGYQTEIIPMYLLAFVLLLLTIDVGYTLYSSIKDAEDRQKNGIKKDGVEI